MCPILALSLSNILYSSLLGRDTYIGFYTEGFYVAVGSISYCFILICTISLYTGFYMYANEMGQDLHTTLQQIERTKKNIWIIYVTEIRFHIEIIE